MSESQIIGMAAVGGMAVIAVAVLWWILQIVANWRIFTKAGEAGWKSIIPVYSGYVSYKIAWKGGMFWVSFIGAILMSYAQNQYETKETVVWMIAYIVFTCIVAVVNIVFCNRLAKAFGHGVGFTIGLILVQPVFLLILGLGNSKYQGAKRLSNS